jgi:hypothetical protein
MCLGRRASGKELGRCPGVDGKGEVAERQLGKRHALDRGKSDGVEADVDAACLLGDLVGVPLDRRLVQRIHLCRLGRPTGHGDLPGHGLHRPEVATTQKDPCPFAPERLRHGTTDRSARPVDDGGLILQQHLPSLSSAASGQTPEAF